MHLKQFPGDEAIGHQVVYVATAQCPQDGDN